MIIYDDDGIGHDVIPTQAVKDAIAEIKELEETIFHTPNTDYEAYGAVHNCIDIIKRHTGVDI